MLPLPQCRIPATYLRGGTSKGVFFRLEDLPPACRVPGPARDALLLRVIGSPDPYGKQIDGMGGGTSSTSKVVIIAPSAYPNHDVDYLFGQVAIEGACVDWTGNCGNLSAAVGPFAIAAGIVDPARVPHRGICSVRIWQANIGKTIVAHVPILDGQVQESGDFMMEGAAFPGAEVRLEFLNPADVGGDRVMFPTGHLIDTLEVPGLGPIEATLINAGIPMLCVDAHALGYTGTELQEAINGDPHALVCLETLRAYGALRMGVIGHLEDMVQHQHTPKLAFVAAPADYVASGGRHVHATEIDVLVRAMSMGRLHHAMMGTAAVALGTAAAIPGTLVNRAAGGGLRRVVRFGHPSGTLQVGAEVHQVNGQWSVANVRMSRSARVLMEGCVRVPAESVQNVD
ncbi:2-methylaconitate cis-trans isomerase PrpF [Xylella fastidiosa]|uniref:3-methylitaconate isomerase n=2 Tax=Xylella fastidiosa TaxID=2371 RepID=A0A060H2T5_XYLFS|nr:2-methylaconitate cis-trans isomerase PrpF [Xylella fastidiosa]AIC09620.1 3-methylitaconate isomerase [Xylella fastidiosa subsp. sandyi Ann-1]UIX81794.1 2-methylaconitate cis-trans isomerase PrpF [Xylella fastidiosa subsp. sandyi]WCF28803.1 2-methylaconitate cis-trans isomerase PrpF [Xylella fastidiosa subsp. fastidiosa]